MARDYVKDIQAVKQLNDLLYESKELSLATDGFQTNLTKMISKSAGKMRESNQYSKENLTNSKAQAKAGKNIIGVLNAQNKGAKLGTMAARAKLKLSRMLNFNMDDQTKKLYEQYDIDQKNLKIKKEKSKLDSKTAKALTGMAKSTLAIFGLTGGIVGLFSQFTKMTAAIGKNFGALGMTNKEFKNDMLQSSAAASSLGQSIDEVVGIQKDLTDNFGFGRDESVAMANGIMDTSMALGLSNQEGTKLLGTLTQIGGMSFDTAQNFAKQTALLAEAEGVSPTTVMRDIAGSSETIAKFTAMTPEHLMKAAIQATKLGTTLDTIAGSMESMLDFQSSLNAEIEAQIMLGRDVNLTKARELALAGKADEFAVELTKQVGSQAEFEKLNVLQRQSLAKALGVSVEQMAKMVNNQDKVYTIGEAIAGQDGLEKMIGREAMDNMAKIVADMQRVGTELVISVGPTVSAIAGEIARFTKGLSESKMLLPAIGAIFSIMATKSLMTAINAASIAFLLNPIGASIGLAAALIGGAAIASMSNGVQQVGDLGMDPNGGPIVASAQMGEVFQGKKGDGLSMGPTFGRNGGSGGMSKQEMESAFANALKPVVEESKKLREQTETLISETKRNPGKIVEGMGSLA